MTDYFALNTETLYSKVDGLRAVFTSSAPNPELEIVSTPSGFPSAVFQGKSVHSRRDPVREADNLIAKEVPPSATICLFYGFGLGYLAESFIRSFPDVPCLVIEPDLSCFLKALVSRDLRHVLTHQPAVFFLASESAEIIRFLETQELSSVHIVKLRSLHEKDRDYYERTDSLIQSFLRQREVNTNTLRRFGRLWVRNLSKNIELLATSPGVKEVQNLFSGIPALVLAGGPSLDAVLPHCGSLRSRMLVIAVDTTLTAVRGGDVDPDFTVVSDPQYWNTRHLDRVGETATVVVSESSTHPRVFRLVKDRILFGSSIFPLGQFLESLVGEKGKLGAGGSVATTAWDFARFLGCTPIIMAGLDLGFPGKKTHYQGAFFEEVFYTVSGRLHPFESRQFAYLQEALPFPVPSNAGGFVLTDHRMAVYKFWFETQMRLHHAQKTLSLSEGGVKIEGMPPVRLPDLENLPVLRNAIDEKMRSFGSLFSHKKRDETKRGDLKKGLEKLVAELDGLADTALEGLRLSRQISENRNQRAPVASVLERLETVDRRIGEMSSKHIAGFLAGPLIKEILSAPASPAVANDALDQSVRLYGELEKSSRYHARLLKNALARLS